MSSSEFLNRGGVFAQVPGLFPQTCILGAAAGERCRQITVLGAGPHERDHASLAHDGVEREDEREEQEQEVGSPPGARGLLASVALCRR